MKKMFKFKAFFGVLIVSFFLAGNAWAIGGGDLSIAKVPNDHLSTVDSWNYKPGFLEVEETYSENRQLIPYESYAGFALVSPEGNFFDKILSWKVNPGQVDLLFQVLNNTGVTWSDYHFEFWAPGFTQQLDVPIWNPASDIFLNTGIVSNGVNFWAPDEVPSGQTVLMGFYVDLTAFGEMGDIGLRQVATAVPEPLSLFLFGGGLLGMAGLKKRKDSMCS